MTPKYEDFFLIVDGSPGNYTVEAQGPGEIRVAPAPFEYDETDRLRIELNRLKAGFAPSRERMQSVGELLFNALFPRRVIRAFERVPDALPRGVNLRVKLIVRPAELSHLPWELLYDPDQEVFLAARLSYSIVRFIETGTPVASLLARRPLRVLYLQANPKGTIPLDTAASEKALRDALGEDGEMVPVRNSSPEALRDVLRENKFHVLHYDGHGAFDEASGRGRLYLHDRQDRAHPLDGEMLATYLDGSSIRLVVLSACETAVDSGEKRFSGIAQQLMRTTRLPAVVAMQYEIPDGSAIAFTREFYKALVDDYPVDAAMVEGRKAILEILGSDPFSQSDWATPVLFMRVKDGDIFRREEEETQMSEEKRKERPDVDTGGGAYIVGGVQVTGGDFVSGDKVVHGDEVRGDKIEGHVGDVGAGAQVAIGKQIVQTIAQVPTALTAAERLELERLMAELKDKLASLDIPETKKLLGLEFVGQLEEELTKTEEPPDASTIKVAGDWLLKNIPALTGTLASLFVNPIVGQVVEAAGDLAAKWVKERLGTRVE